MTDTSQEGVVAPEENEGEGTGEVVSIPKKDYDLLNQTLGSLKREVKDLKKAKDEPKETKETPQTKPEEFGLLQKLALQVSGVNISDTDEVELAREIQKKTNLEWDKLGNDDYFKHKLEALRTSKSNAIATKDIRGGQGDSQAKNAPSYWLAKGVPPTAKDVPDRKTRANIVRAFIAKSGTNGKTFYND